MIRLVPMLALLVFVASGCVEAACACAPPNLQVFGASSLSHALDEFATAYEATGRVSAVTPATGSSGSLRVQIEQGAPADLFLAADTANPQALFDSGLSDGPPMPFATNHLIVVVPEENPAGITSAADLARPNVAVIAAGEDVPITRYAEQLVTNLAALPGYPPDFAAAYAANIASREDNVGAVVSKIELGEGDAAIVYVTDAGAASVQSVEIPIEADVVATYSGVILKRTQHPVASRDLLDWIRGAGGQTILVDLGFSPAP